MNKLPIKKRWLEKTEKNTATYALNALYPRKEKIYPDFYCLDCLHSFRTKHKL